VGSRPAASSALPAAADARPRRSPGQASNFFGHFGANWQWTPGALLANDGPMTVQPVNLPQTLAGFDEIYSPRIVARVNNYDVRVAHTRGEHVWHVHDDTDEFFLVLDGQFDIALRDGHGCEHTVALRQGDTFVVPKGTEHKPSSPGGSILMFEPSGTSTTGDRHEGGIPGHVDSTVGHEL
jgi:mannose-6-phosphate isomerase-like protein (cupin superfamily)